MLAVERVLLNDVLLVFVTGRGVSKGHAWQGLIWLKFVSADSSIGLAFSLIFLKRHCFRKCWILDRGSVFVVFWKLRTTHSQACTFEIPVPVTKTNKKSFKSTRLVANMQRKSKRACLKTILPVRENANSYLMITSYCHGFWLFSHSSPMTVIAHQWQP